jgi:putative membrane protein
MIGGLALLLASAQLGQPYPGVAPLHHIPTLLLVVAAPMLLRRWPMSNAAVLCVVSFFALHTIGGRYTYSNVPYDALAQALFGTSVSDALSLERNHYDRFAHLAYGMLAVRPTFEILRRHLAVGSRFALFVAVASVLAVSALYEMFEWALSLVLAGGAADDYNGQQGDAWDAQKDMALATLGAIAGALIVRACRPNSAAGSPGSAASGYNSRAPS